MAAATGRVSFRAEPRHGRNVGLFILFYFPVSFIFPLVYMTDCHHHDSQDHNTKTDLVSGEQDTAVSTHGFVAQPASTGDFT